MKKFTRELESDWVVKNDAPHYGIKEHAAVDVENGFVLSTNITPCSHHDSTYLPYAAIYSMHIDQPIEKIYCDKGYAGAPNRKFLSMNSIADGIMRKDNVNAALKEAEILRKNAISKKRYIVEQYFGISSLHDDGNRLALQLSSRTPSMPCSDNLPLICVKGPKSSEPCLLNRHWCARTHKSGLMGLV